MVQNPRVSICIPTYNGREHLKECLDSIRAQTFQNFEVVICDDQSPDGTLDLARELVQDDERFRFIKNPRRFGLVGNWNNCIAIARGEWIKLVFQDDLIAPTCVEKLLSAAEQTGKAFAFCARDFIFEEGVKPSLRAEFALHQAELDSLYREKPVVETGEVIRLAIQKPCFNLVGEPTVTLIRKSVFEKVGLFDDALIQLCDVEFWFRSLSNFGAVWVPEKLATFRIHAKATTAANHGGRSYRTVVLDPLVILYRFAFGRHFSNLRASQLPDNSFLSLKIKCAVAAYHARSKAQTPELMKEWRAVTLSCPRLPLLAKLGQAIAGYRFAKTLARRALRKIGFAGRQ